MIIQPALKHDDYTVIYQVVGGSTLHGTQVPDSPGDLDLTAVVFEHPRFLFSLSTEDTWTFRTQPEGARSGNGDIDFTAYGLRKFVALASKSNPTILSLLFAPPEMVKNSSKWGRELQAMAPCFISKQVYHTFAGYMHSEFQRLTGERGQKNVKRPELVEKYGYDTKYASHIVRLGFQGVELLDKAGLTLPLQKSIADCVVSIRTGGFSYQRVLEFIKSLEADLTKAYNRCSLPELPDYSTINAWMTTAYVEMLEAHSKHSPINLEDEFNIMKE